MSWRNIDEVMNIILKSKKFFLKNKIMGLIHQLGARKSCFECPEVFLSKTFRMKLSDNLQITNHMEEGAGHKISINTQETESREKSTLMPKLNFFLFFCLIILVCANQILLNDINKKFGLEFNLKNEIAKISSKDKIYSGLGSDPANQIELVGDISKDALNLIILKGIPAVYGLEMGGSFDDVQGAINVMRQFDPYDLRPGGKRIIPQGENFQRYIAIAGKISCEFCCNATSIIDQKNGQFACGCAHSMALRGLAAYLVEKHGIEYSNDEILRELARWKGMYFPKQMIKKVSDQLQNGKYTPDIASIILGLDLPKYAEASSSAPLPSDIENLPSMVGGC